MAKIWLGTESNIQWWVEYWKSSKSTIISFEFYLSKSKYSNLKTYLNKSKKVLVIKLLKLQVTLHFCIGVLGSVIKTKRVWVSERERERDAHTFLHKLLHCVYCSLNKHTTIRTTKKLFNFKQIYAKKLINFSSAYEKRQEFCRNTTNETLTRLAWLAD